MIAARFRTIGWVAGVASAALGCYLVSQSVAAERATLVKVDRSIDDTRAEIARLTTEIGTRGRMSQIDRWNAENFALQAPGARQFLASETQLASFGRPRPALPVDPDIAATKGAVQEAAFHPRPTPVIPVAPEAEAPAAIRPELPQPMLRVASYVRPKSDRLAQEEAAPVVKVAMVRTIDEAPKPHPAAAGKPLSLLPDDIDSLAADEQAKQIKRKAREVNAPATIRFEGKASPLFRTPQPAPGTQPLALSHFRLMVAMLLFMLATLVIAGRLVQLCLFGGKAGGSGVVAEAPRGDILDRNGLPLATTIQAWSIAINPQTVLGDRARLAHQLALLLPEKSEDYYRAILFSKTRKFVWLREHAMPSVVAQVHALGEPAIMELRHQQRLYPQATLAGHVLGYAQMVANARTKKDELTGIGVERYFDDQLRQGKPLQLSLDLRVQAALEGEIARRMGEVQAVGGAGVVMDANTGEVIALASLPSINPNAPLRAQADIPNKATGLTYELGSTFKMLTFANAIEHGVITDFAKTYDISSPLHIGGHTIHDDEPKHRAVTIPEVMTFSSNIGTALIADEIGADRIKSFFKLMGLNERTSIELRERAMPQVPSYWARTTIMTTAFGHGIAVTPLHLAQAYAALANGGVWHPATLRKHVDGQPIPSKRVISEATSARMRQLMRLVVLQGTGTNANAPGLRVGGKTGTAEKVVSGRYVKTANVTTFAGAFPMDHPRYVVLVMLDDAKASKETYGFKTAGWMTAPLAKRVIRRIGPLLGITPDESRDVDVSDLMALLAEKKDPDKNAID